MCVRERESTYTYIHTHLRAGDGQQGQRPGPGRHPHRPRLSRWYVRTSLRCIYMCVCRPARSMLGRPPRQTEASVCVSGKLRYIRMRAVYDHITQKHTHTKQHTYSRTDGPDVPMPSAAVKASSRMFPSVKERVRVALSSGGVFKCVRALLFIFLACLQAGRHAPMLGAAVASLGLFGLARLTRSDGLTTLTHHPHTHVKHNATQRHAGAGPVGRHIPPARLLPVPTAGHPPKRRWWRIRRRRRRRQQQHPSGRPHGLMSGTGTVAD